MRKLELRKMIREEIQRIQEYNPKYGMDKKWYKRKKDEARELIAKKLRLKPKDIGIFDVDPPEWAKFWIKKDSKEYPWETKMFFYYYKTKKIKEIPNTISTPNWAKKNNESFKKELVKIIEEGAQIHFKGWKAELMPDGKILWLMPNKGGKDWKKEKGYLKNFYGNVKFEPHELDTLEVKLPKKTDKVEVELVLSGKMEE